MTKETLIEMIGKGMSLNQISKEVGKGLTTVRYWAKKHQVEFPNKPFNEIGKKDYGESRVCPRCNQNCNITEFYNRRGKENSSVYCKKCTGLQTVERQRKLKKQMVDYKGGKCERCGYDKYIGALEFHHLNPEEKDFSLSQLKTYSFNHVIVEELNKCILVCSNCHREIHGEQMNSVYPRQDSNL
jgi:5-methylcytosine-specific restriction endonuclease McrA